MRRILFCLVLLLSMLLVPAAAFAQDECTGVMDPDSDFLTFSKEAMAQVSSYASVAGLHFSLEDAPGLPRELSATLDMDGRYLLDPDLIARMMAIEEMDPAEMEENMAEIMDMVVELYQTISFDMEMDYGFSTDLAQLIAASSGMKAFPSAVSMPVRMVDGFVYVNFDGISDAFGAGDQIGGWFGFDYGTFVADAVAEMNAGSGAASSTAATTASSVASTMFMQHAIKQYATIEGKGISTVSGIDVCEVATTYDLAGFLSDPEFVQMMVEQMKAQAAMQAEMGTEDEMPMTDEDIDMIAEMVPMLAPLLLSGLKLESVSTIGVEDGLVYSNNSHFEWDMAGVANILGALMQQGEMASPLDPDNPPFVSMSIFAENSEFNESFEVEVPDPVEIIPLESLQSQE